MATTAPIRELYPPIEPYMTGRLQVDTIHNLYFEQSGNPNGKPVIFVHGGPGGGVEGWYRQFFNPEKYRIILFDQRGAGKSTPHACLENNTTWDLVSDMEKLREHLQIDGKWVVFGGSWGSTLSLVYAISHPERVEALILRGIFLCRKKEIDWFYQSGASFLFPEAFEAYKSVIPLEEQNDLVTAFYKRLTGTDEEEKLKCATAWSVWELATSRLYVDPKYIARAAENPQFALAFARIECHYFHHNIFIESDQWILDNIHKIAHIPGVTLQGRYDMVCPPVSAYELHQKWTSGQLIMIHDAGHSMKEPGILSGLIEAADKFSN